MTKWKRTSYGYHVSTMPHTTPVIIGGGNGPNYTNEPPGYTPLVDHTFSTIVGWDNPNTSWSDVVADTDASAPKSPSTVVKHIYPAGNGAGPIPSRVFNFANQRELYACFWFKLSDPFTLHPSAVSKQFFIGTNQSGITSNEVVFAIIGTVMASASIRGIVQDPVQAAPPTGPPTGTGGYFTNNVSTGIWSFGVYNKVEIRLVRSTGGLYNGSMRWWLNEVLVGQHLNVRYNSTTDAVYNLFLDQHYWGGDPETGTKAQEDYTWDDHLYVSGIAA